MKKKKTLMIVIAVLIVAGIFVKAKFPYIDIDFLKDSIFPPASVVDAKTQATAVIYTKKLNIEEIYKMINSTDRVIVVSTVNLDGSPHAGVFKIREFNGKIELSGFSEKQTCNNLERSSKAVITVYKRPEKNKKWFQSIGARLWVKLLDKKGNDLYKLKYLLEIEQFRAI